MSLHDEPPPQNLAKQIVAMQLFGFFACWVIGWFRFPELFVFPRVVMATVQGTWGAMLVRVAWWAAAASRKGDDD